MKRRKVDKVDILTFAKLFLKEDGSPLTSSPGRSRRILKPVFYDQDENRLRRINSPWS